MNLLRSPFLVFKITPGIFILIKDLIIPLLVKHVRGNQVLDYFPEIAQHVLKVFPPIDEVTDIISGTGKWQTLIKKFPLPPDLADKNMCAAWAKPEMYFDAQIRRNTSGFALAAPDVVERGLKRLQHDLKSGQWDSKYGHLRRRKHFDAGFRFLKFTEPKKR